MTDSIPKPIQHLSVQEAAAAIMSLINASPRSPWPSEIEAIVAKAAQVKLIRDLDTERGLDVVDEALAAVDHAKWRKLVIEAEDTLRAKDLLVDDPRLPAAEAISDAAYERLHAFEAAIWERPARGLGDLPLLADLLVYQMWPGYALTGAFPGNKAADFNALVEQGAYCEGEPVTTAAAALLRAIRDLIGMPKAMDASDAALIDKVRTAMVRERVAGERYGNDMTDDPRFCEEYKASWADLQEIQKSIPYPPRTAAQMLCHAEIAYLGADKNQDGTLDVADNDCFEGTAARLIEACMAYFGGQRPS